MYICKPERDPKQVKLLFFGSILVLAGLLFITSHTAGYIRLFSRFLAFAALLLAILFNIRYSLTEFEYAIKNGDFIVTRITGNRRQEVCCIALETSVGLYTKRDYEHLPSAEKGIIKYSLNQNIKADSYVYLCEFNGKRAKIEFEPNEAFVSIMKREIDMAKQGE